MSCLALLLKLVLGVSVCLGGALWARKNVGRLTGLIHGAFAPKSGIDYKDCYFDRDCHGKVDWNKIGEMKEGFFARLKILKEKKDVGDVKLLMKGMHVGFAKAGVPDDRIDYILTKWLQYSYPEALQELYKKSNIVVSGFQCENGYGKDLNQKYVFQGMTKDKRPYYRGVSRPDRYIYYDKYCADDTREPRWLLGGQPDVGREFDMNVNDGKGCDNDFAIQTDSQHMPIGLQRATWQWCGDHGHSHSKSVTISYEDPSEVAKADSKPADECSKYEAWGGMALRGCRDCAKAYPYPGGADGCMSCGKKCQTHCPPGSDYKCYQGGEFLRCHKTCMRGAKPTVDKKRFVDKKDCYFDPECHEKVDWSQIAKMKEVFFSHLKKLKEEGSRDVKPAMIRMHRGFAQAGMPEDRIDYILMKWLKYVYPEALDKPDEAPAVKTKASDGECEKAKFFGETALKGCQQCAKAYPGHADGCMACGKKCRSECPTGSDFSCFKGGAFLRCHMSCMREEPHVTPAGIMWAKAAERNRAIHEKQGLQEDHPLSFYAVDKKDCYFDKDCYAKVDWSMVEKMKNGFFARLKLLKEKNDVRAVRNLFVRAHPIFAKAGIPDDRIDYMLAKWVKEVFPEAVTSLAPDPVMPGAPPPQLPAVVPPVPPSPPPPPPPADFASSDPHVVRMSDVQV